MDIFTDLKHRLRQFATERDWDQFHAPKNLAMALSGEVGELLEHFQWLTEAESKNLPPEKLALVADELADVQLYLIRLADKLNVDLAATAFKKIDKNAAKYPVEKAKGRADKYTAY